MSSQTTLTKQEADLLYHLLRKAAVSSERDVIGKLAKHLLQGPWYKGLLSFSSWYGRTYLLERIPWHVWEGEVSRVLELGAGYGWLGKGLSKKLKVPYLSVDKRKENKPHIVLDLETWAGIEKLCAILGREDLVVMSDLLHCMEPGWVLELMDVLSENRLLILEYDVQGEYGAVSYTHLTLPTNREV